MAQLHAQTGLIRFKLALDSGVNQVWASKTLSLLSEFDVIILLALWTSLATLGTEKEENPPPPTNPRSIPFYQPPCSCMGREWRPQLPSRTGIKPRPFRSGQSDPREGAETASLRCKIPVLASGNPKTRIFWTWLDEGLWGQGRSLRLTFLFLLAGSQVL